METTKRRIDLSDNRYMEVEKCIGGFDIMVWESMPEETEDLLNVIENLNPEDLDKIVEVLSKFLDDKNGK